MKNIIYTILVLNVLFCTGCTDQLEETIYGKFPEEEYWKTESELLTGLASAYGRLVIPWDAPFSLEVFKIEECASDYAVGAGEWGDYTGWSSIFPGAINNVYDYLWSSISYCNKVIDKSEEGFQKTQAGEPGYSISKEVKEQIIVESRAVRVFCYFNLCTWFGGVPIVTSSTDHRPIIPKQTQDSVYRFMENELKEVIPFLPTKSERMNMTKDYGRVTKGGAEAFLARIYLEQKKWQECADLTTKLYEDNQRTREYGLEGNYADIFSLQNEGYSNSEIMWALPAAGCINGKAVSGMVLHAQLSRPKKDEEGQPDSGYFPNNYNWGDMSVKRDFYNTFDKNDKRRELLVTVFTDLKTGRLIDWLAESEWNKPIMNKYPADPSTDGSVSGNDFIIIRWADVLLMRAEALNELGDAGEAVDMVNLVRNRAGLRELDATADFGNDKKKISDHIYNERRWEFYFECQGRRTMKRFNKLVDHIARTSGDAGTNVARYLYLPFPAVAVTANPGLTQNSGYK